MYAPIIGTLAYILSPERTHVLLVRRTARPHDHHFGKYNGLGGKLKPDEDVLSGLTREIREEAGIECEEVRLRGTVNWPGFGPEGEHWLGFIFLVSRFSGTPHTRNEEGELAWHVLEDLANLPMWEGDKYFLPLVFDDDPRTFHGHMPYKNGQPLSWSYRRG
ncbi:MAG: NUDIX hydrolase [Desulfobulbaceae bacterium]